AAHQRAARRAGPDVLVQPVALRRSESPLHERDDGIFRRTAHARPGRKSRRHDPGIQIAPSGPCRRAGPAERRMTGRLARRFVEGMGREVDAERAGAELESRLAALAAAGADAWPRI